MAPMGESSYFPPLDRCLEGSSQLLSWENVYCGLTQQSHSIGNRSLKRHLTDTYTIQLLIQAFAPFASPGPQSRASFETKTSAINVTPTGQGRYDIKQLKEDALWLSKETNIDELSALRIAVVEWQTRPVKKLLQTFPWEETLLQELEAGSGIGLPNPRANPAGVISGWSSDRSGSSTFNSSQSRRLRLLDVYLSERRYLIKTCDHIVFTTLHRSSNTGEDSPHESAQNELETPLWMERIGDTILTAWNVEGQMANQNKGFIVDAVDAIISRLEGLDRGCGWLKDEGLEEAVELAWSRNQILETIHIMQILLSVVESSTRLSRSDSVLAWLRCMATYRFFDELEPLLRSLSGPYDLILQSLVALISLALLKLPIAFQALGAMSNLAVSNLEYTESAHYLINRASIVEINETLMDAAKECISTASLAVFAWGMILQTLRERALISKNERETRQSQRAVDRYGAADSSDNDGSEGSIERRKSSPQRRSSIGSDTSQQPTLLEELLDRIMDTNSNQDPIVYLAQSAVDGSHVFDLISSLATGFCTTQGSEHSGKSGLKMRLVLFDLVKAAADWLGYQPELVSATLAVLTGSERYWEILERPLQFADAELASLFLNDDVLMPRIFLNAQAHFPYEILPFVKICRALSVGNPIADTERVSLGQLLGSIDHFTCKVSTEFANWRTYEGNEGKEDDPNLELLSSLEWLRRGRSSASSLVPRNNQSLVLGADGKNSESFLIPPGTLGRSLTNGKPLVVMWDHSYSGLSFLGALLQRVSEPIALPPDLERSNPTEIASEIIGLITTMIISATKYNNLQQRASGPEHPAQLILEEASDGLTRNQDIVSVIFGIFEDELHRRHSLPDGEDVMYLLIQCIQFMHALLPVLPGRVWPFLTRSDLLGTAGKTSRLAAVVANNEVIMGRYDFLLGCIRVFEALVEDALVNAVPRRTRSKAVTRFQASDVAGTGISDTAVKNVLLSFEKIMIDVFESSFSWKFVLRHERCEINTRICNIVQRILLVCFAVDDTTDISHKLTGPLAPSADYLLDVFLSKSGDYLSTKPLLDIFREGIITPSSTLPTLGLQYRTSQVVATLELSTTLVRLNQYLRYKPAQLEEQFFKATPVLARLYAAHETYRLPVVELLEALVNSSGSTDSQPPSLLGQLGQGTAKTFLDILSMLDTPLDNDDLSSAIWRLLSAVVSQRQQWFAVFLFTGSTPRDSLKSSNIADSHHSRPMLRLALENLSNIERLRPETSTSMLEFVALAADFWPWVMTDIQKETAFVTAITDFVAGMNTAPVGSKASSVDFRQTQNAALITKILAMYVHHCHQMGDNSFAKSALPRLQYLFRKGVAVPTYNSSLHGNLHKNFEARYEGCSLTNFKRTTLIRSRLGSSFLYDTQVAGQLLAYDPAWTGLSNQGFMEEISRANVNLSLVEAQVNLFHSWKFLIVELSSVLSTDSNFQKSAVVVIRECLASNNEESFTEAIFDRLSQSRADLAFTLLQQATGVPAFDAETSSILAPAWAIVRDKMPNLGTGLIGNDADYNRILLRILYLALQSQSSQRSELDTSISRNSAVPSTGGSRSSTDLIVLDVLGSVVAHGFRSLTTALHDDSLQVLPADFALITAVLRACLCVAGVNRHATQLVSRFTDDDTARYACALLSWSDQLTIEGDPIYGELSVQFILELSSIPALAESMAVEGILTHVSTTNIMNYFRRPEGIGPFNEPTRIYNIWSRGIVLLVLNLLDSIGAPIAAEAAAFLDQFRPQLIRASSVFDSKSAMVSQDSTAGYITLAMASEAQSLALIATILDTFREAGASAGIVASSVIELHWDRQQVKEDLGSWMQRRKALRERIVATNVREQEWSRQSPLDATTSSENRLEEKIVGEMNDVLLMLNGSAA